MERDFGETVLGVDDEDNVRMLLVEQLGETAYPASTCSSPTSGCRAASTGARSPTRRAQRPGLKVLFITGYAENSVIGAGHLEPGMAVLLKPSRWRRSAPG